jgi:hypothetical protein
MKLLLAICTVSFSTAVIAGARIEYRYQIESLTGDKANQRVGKGSLELAIDGVRFQVRRAHGATTMSLDDGATTFLDTDPVKRSSPLAIEVAGVLDPIAAHIEDESIKLNEAQPGPVLFGQATQVYEIEHRYTTVARMAVVFSRRFRQHVHYQLTVSGTDLSPAAMRVVLAGGYGRALAFRADAFAGLPLKVKGVMFNVAEDDTETLSARFSYEATAISPWTWPAGAAQN